MGIQIQAIRDVSKLLGSREAAEIIALAKRVEIVEAEWKRKLKSEIEQRTRSILDNAEKTGRLNFGELDFVDFFMQQSFEVLKQGIQSTVRMPPVRSQRLAAVPKGKIPRSLRDLRIWWDAYRKTGRPSARQKELGEKLKKAYIDKVQSVWEKHGEDFRSGETASRSGAVKKIMDGADVAYARGKMIVETENTYYYNKARREVYDDSDDVTHYLFMPIRDHRTTKWCKTRAKLVYKKGDPILDKETPPIHWNCRSELLPLTPINPVHRKLIEDKNLWRRNNACEPLPPGWTGR